MRGMQSESVDLIYLDPPFNSNHNYAAPIGSKAAGAAFKDTWTLDDIDEVWWEEIRDSNKGLHDILEAAGTIGGDSIKSYLIYMAIRIIEMHRLLKDTGSLYLHCDPTMSHYLKMVLDAIFRQQNFINEIIWKRFSSHNDGRRYGKVSDTILYYAKTRSYVWNKTYMPYSEDYIKENYDNEDERGRYTHRPLTAESLSGGGYDYEFHGHRRIWKRPFESMKELERNDMLHFPRKKGGIPRYKIYLANAKGIPLQNIWTDIPNVQGSERLSYPTQKPLALLERLIRASSNDGDWVLDPFCGCATACSASEKLGRKWIGIDISSKAHDLLKDRLKREAGLDKFTKGAGILIHRTDIPIRKGRVSKDIKQTLYGKQKGYCAGCRKHFEIRHFHKDHMIPKAKGGADDDSNLQLLCGHCNTLKGDGTMEELLAKLKSMGIL